MGPTIRHARLDDLPAMVELLTVGVEHRRAMNPALWRVAPDARTRIEAAVQAGLAPDASPKQTWLLAYVAGGLVGLAHGMVAPPPPIYDIATPPGLLLDDCYVTTDAPAGAAKALLAAMEEALREAGAGALIASCPVSGAWRSLYAAAGYDPVTLYMAKAGLTQRSATTDVRPAGPDDIAGIVRLSAEHRRTLAALNPRFWPTHPDADNRFARWMGFSLTLKDRDMLVAGPSGATTGYIVAQPMSPLHIPAGHELAGSGLVDDFYAHGFAQVARLSNDGGTATALVAAAEDAFKRRGVETALIVCPAAWASKAALLERSGYRTAKLWMLKGA
jgi:hypothetical protein